MATEPLAGWRLTKVTERRTKTEWARFNTHLPALYETFEAVRAKAL